MMHALSVKEEASEHKAVCALPGHTWGHRDVPRSTCGTGQPNTVRETV